MQRTERTGPATNDSQASPNKLTMAQAALLNLHGGDANRNMHPMGMSPQVSPVLGGYPGPSPTFPMGGFQAPPSFNTPPMLQATGLSPALQQPSPAHTRLPQHPLVAPYAVQPAPPAAPVAPALDANLAALLTGLQMSAAATGHEPGAPALGRAFGSGGVRPKFNAFTPIEQQLLLQAQAQQRVLEAQTKALELQRAVVLEAQARLAQQQQPPPRAAVEIVPTPAEEQEQQRARTATATATALHAGHGRLMSLDYGKPAPAAPASHARSTTLPGVPRVLVAPTESPLMASPALSFSSASSSVGLSPMTPAFVPSGLGPDGALEVTAGNVKPPVSGDGAVQVVGLGVDMGQ
jgi:hypothetical protein